jgi:hypothetical protein
MTFELHANIIDSRDIVKRLEELQEEKEALEEAITDCKESVSEAFDAWERDTDSEELKDDHGKSLELLATAEEVLTDWIAENGEELTMLESVNEEGENYCPDWTHGETLIEEDYFVEYAQELVSDIGDLPENIPSYIVIDWKATADNLLSDYSYIDIDGTKYYIRSY